jgi:hypothetical protein
MRSGAHYLSVEDFDGVSAVIVTTTLGQLPLRL